MAGRRRGVTEYPGVTARRLPDKPAVIMGSTGRVVTYRELDERSNRLAHVLRSAGLGVGDNIALLVENHERFFEICWAALRSGLYCTPVSTALTAEEAVYIVGDCGARALIVSASLDQSSALVARADVAVCLSLDGAVPGCASYEHALVAAPPVPHADEPEGSMMLYSSGTTGRPKAVKRPLSGRPAGSSNPLTPFLPHVGLDESTVYLSTAPLYHAAPIGWSLGTHRVAGIVVVMERFDARRALELIERHRVTHAQFVPTMFSRLLDVPEDERGGYDLSSLRKVIHAAAPCPVPVKRKMIAWLGEIVDEYYSGTEGVGITYITTPEWLAHPGSVGRPILGEIHIVDDDGHDLAPGEVGTVYFSSGDTRATLDDMGYVDGDGYLYLTDRRGHMIVSGGVNISPSEVEQVILEHPGVTDVAVIGVPNADFGEEVKAVVQPAADVDVDALRDAVIALCRARLARYKCPRSVDVVDELPRNEAGKLLKRVLRDRYWEGHATRIV